MAIKGFQGTSLLDYPGHIAALVFFGGCNLTCSYCHNPTLVLEPDTIPDFPQEDLLSELQRRRNFIDGVVISGGEPTLDPQLLPLLRQIKELGLQVKLDTNGLAPKVLKELIWEGLVDLVALDLKTAPGRYGELHTGPVATDNLAESVRLLMDGPVDCEFRTTCMPGLVGEAEILELGEMIRGAERWMLQQYVPRHALAESAQAVEPYQAEQIEALAMVARQFVDEVGVRGL